MTTETKKPFEITVTGSAEIPRPAERAIIDLSVQSSGPDKAKVSTEVLDTTQRIEAFLRALEAKDNTTEAKESSPLAHWSKTSLSSTSYQPYNHNDPDKPHPRQYTATIKFDVRFRDFKALGAFGTKLSPLQHVEVQNIDWALTSETEKSFRSQLRKEAARDAMQKARDYCEVLGCENVRPVELHEGNVGSVSRGNSRYGRDQYHASPMMARNAAPGGMAAGEEERAEDLSFDAQEVKLSMQVTVKFHAE